MPSTIPGGRCLRICCLFVRHVFEQVSLLGVRRNRGHDQFRQFSEAPLLHWQLMLNCIVVIDVDGIDVVVCSEVVCADVDVVIRDGSVDVDIGFHVQRACSTMGKAIA